MIEIKESVLVAIIFLNLNIFHIKQKINVLIVMKKKIEKLFGLLGKD
jgi:hypothetical protein